MYIPLTDPRQFDILNPALAGGDRMQLDLRRREFITLLGTAVYLFFCVNAAAQEGYYGVGHDKWHQGLLLKTQKKRWPRLVLQSDGL